MQQQEYQEAAQAFWDSLHRPWKAAVCKEDTNAMWIMWTWVAEQFRPLELCEDGTTKITMQTPWQGPPGVENDPVGVRQAREGHNTHDSCHKVVP